MWFNGQAIRDDKDVFRAVHYPNLGYDSDSDLDEFDADLVESSADESEDLEEESEDHKSQKKSLKMRETLRLKCMKICMKRMI